MIETLILSLLCGLLGGFLGYCITSTNISTIKTKNGYIRYMMGKNTEFVTVVDKTGKELLDASFAINKDGINYVEYATKI
jgi:hypothetical protein|nr:MAG TPA: YhzD-like protein [Caudoviricetes sp.]